MPSLRLRTGITCYYEERGQGDPLLFISGAGADHSDWNIQAHHFGDEFRVIIFDNRGIGRTDAPQGLEHYSVPLMADDTAALMEALEIRKAHVIGQSLGSAIAQELALAHPEKVKSLQLTVTWGRSDERIRNICRTMSILIEGGHIEDYARYVYSLAFSPPLLEGQPTLVSELYRTVFLENPHRPSVHGLLGQWHAVSRHDTIDRLGTLRIPAMVVTGEGDILMHPVYSRKTADAISHSIFHCFRGDRASHLLHVEMAGSFNRIMEDFLKAAC